MVEVIMGLMVQRYLFQSKKYGSQNVSILNGIKKNCIRVE